MARLTNISYNISMDLELKNIRIFDVLRNSLNNEMSLVMAVSGDRIDMRIKTGDIVRFKFGKNFSKVSHDEAVDFRAHLQAVRKAALLASPPKKRRKRLLALPTRRR